MAQGQDGVGSSQPGRVHAEGRIGKFSGRCHAVGSGNRHPAMELRHERHQAQHALSPEASRSSYNETVSGAEANVRH